MGERWMTGIIVEVAGMIGGSRWLCHGQEKRHIDTWQLKVSGLMHWKLSPWLNDSFSHIYYPLLLLPLSHIVIVPHLFLKTRPQLSLFCSLLWNLSSDVVAPLFHILILMSVSMYCRWMCDCKVLLKIMYAQLTFPQMNTGYQNNETSAVAPFYLFSLYFLHKWQGNQERNHTLMAWD